MEPVGALVIVGEMSVSLARSTVVLSCLLHGLSLCHLGRWLLQYLTAERLWLLYLCTAQRGLLTGVELPVTRNLAFSFDAQEC